jgi:hypothetical protein
MKLNKKNITHLSELVKNKNLRIKMYLHGLVQLGLCRESFCVFFWLINQNIVENNPCCSFSFSNEKRREEKNVYVYVVVGVIDE